MIDPKTGTVARLSKLVSNVSIEDRIAHPEMYNRDGKLLKEFRKQRRKEERKLAERDRELTAKQGRSRSL